MSSPEKFPAFLRYLVEHKDYQASTIATESGLYPGDVSRFISGKRKCGEKVFAKLIHGIREDDRADAIMNWLRDQIPEGQEEYVHVVRAMSSTLREEEPANPHTLEGALEILKREAAKSAPLANVLMSLAQTYQR